MMEVNESGSTPEQEVNQTAKAETGTETGTVSKETIEQAKAETMTIDEMEERLKTLETTNQRLLEESKKHKSQKQKVQEELLLAQNKKDELIQTQRKQLEEMKERIMSARIADAVASEAAKRGCQHWDHLLQVGDTSFIDYDDETETVNGVKDFFDKHQNDENYGIYFQKKEAVLTNNHTPSIEAGFDYRKDPLGYLSKCKEISPAKYKEAVQKLRHEGLLR